MMFLTNCPQGGCIKLLDDFSWDSIYLYESWYEDMGIEHTLVDDTSLYTLTLPP